MALKDVKVPLYRPSGEDEGRELIINEFAGRIQLDVVEYSSADSPKKEIHIELYFDDLERAWEAVKRF